MKEFNDNKNELSENNIKYHSLLNILKKEPSEELFEIPNNSKIAIFRTVWWKSFDKILNGILTTLAQNQIILIGRKEDVEYIKEYPEIKLLIVDGEEPYSIKNCSEHIDYIKKNGVNFIGFITGGKSLKMYDNMFELFESEDEIEKVIINKEGKISKYEASLEYIKAWSEYEKLCDWYWEKGDV